MAALQAAEEAVAAAVRDAKAVELRIHESGIASTPVTSPPLEEDYDGTPSGKPRKKRCGALPETACGFGAMSECGEPGNKDGGSFNFRRTRDTFCSE